ncbi:MAG: hypothetical protein ACO3SO_08730 [Luteolibacter sp.]
MIISKPEITEEQDDVCLSAAIRIERKGITLPDRLWFKIPKQHAGNIHAGADAFVVAMLPSAMNVGENILVEGSVSPKLAFGLDHYQHMQNLWWPELFSRVRISFSGYEARTARREKAVGVAFSGGVDSSYTLWKHLPENETTPGFAITHALVINGFDKDTDLNLEGSFRKLRQTYEPVLKSHGAEFVSLRTNIRSFREAINMPGTGLEKSYGVALAAAVLALGGFYSRFYIPGSARLPRDAHHPEGTHLLLDSWLSSESVDFIHDGADVTRVEKTLAISAWPAMHQCLRVCIDKPAYSPSTGVVENCCRCEKCLRTMIVLEAMGEIGKFDTFPDPIDLNLIRKLIFKADSAYLFSQENLELAKRENRADLAAAIQHAIRCSDWKRSSVRKRISKRLRGRRRSIL